MDKIMIESSNKNKKTLQPSRQHKREHQLLYKIEESFHSSFSTKYSRRDNEFHRGRWYKAQECQILQ